MPKVRRQIRTSATGSLLIAILAFPFAYVGFAALLYAILMMVLSAASPRPIPEAIQDVITTSLTVLPLLLAYLASRALYFALRTEVTVEEYVDGRYCVECGYDLTGNVSGRCPECGMLIAPPSALRQDEPLNPSAP